MCSFLKHMDNIMNTAMDIFSLLALKIENIGVAHHIFCPLAMNSK